MEFLLEIGVEEIPAAFLPEGRRNLEKAFASHFAGFPSFIASCRPRVYGTPRRLTLHVSDIPARSEDVVEKHKGPPARVAFDAEGRPTKAAEGFARKVGVGIEALKREGEYVTAEVTVAGRPAKELLVEAVPAVLSALPWPKSMRWNATGVRFVRPVRWIVALVDAEVLPVSWSGLTAGRTSWIRRMTDADGVASPVEIPATGAYLETLAGHGVLVDPERRAAVIRRQLEEAAIREGAEPVFMDGETTVPYLADHVEDPEIMVGDFDETYTRAPREVLELTMWRHQKYVPLVSGDRLLPRFLVVSNRTFGQNAEAAAEARRRENVAAGNRRVLSARLSDANYFWATDLERRLADRVEDLGRVTFHKDVGSMLERVNRIEGTAARIAPLLGVEDVDAVRRAARLSKADLTTKMVFEFPELQGVIGRRLAEAQGEPAPVAAAIEEHYWPLGADPRVPRGVSACVALAEKSDTLHSIFGAGMEPTGSADPFALRRAAIGIVRILLEHGRPFDLRELIRDEKVLAFVRQRALNHLVERGEGRMNAGIAEAVAAVGWTDLPDLERRARAASQLRERADFDDMATSFKRVMNILEPSDDVAPAVDGSLLVEEAEKALMGAADALDREVAGSLAQGRVDDALTAMAGVRPAVDRFFDDVLVNADDAALRRNRKALLARLGSIFLRVLDFSRL